MDAFDRLGLSAEATADEVRAAWRRLAQRHHPDRGGDQSTFVSLQAAYRVALAAALVPKVCTTCQGSGRVLTQRGWTTAYLYCAACDGLGTMERASEAGSGHPG